MVVQTGGMAQRWCKRALLAVTFMSWASARTSLQLRGGSAAVTTPISNSSLNGSAAPTLSGLRPAPDMELMAPSDIPFPDVSTETRRDAIKAYFKGAKQLWADVKLWRALRQRHQPLHRLTWREHKVQANAPKHALRMLPLLANPLPPPFGLVLIGVAATMPRTLLTPQFWTDGQCYAFARKDGEGARRRHAKLLEELTRKTSQGRAPTAAPLPGDVVAEPAAAAEGAGAAPDLGSLGSVADAFCDGGGLALEDLSRRHLIRLARCARPRPKGRFGLRFTRNRKIRAVLAAAAAAAKAEDDALDADLSTPDGDVCLSNRELLEVCGARGIRVDGTHAARLARLKFWLQARRLLLRSSPEQPPPSLLLHLPALLSTLLEQTHAEDLAKELR